MAALGENQIGVLRALVNHGHYGSGGWVWGNKSTTERIMGSLVKRGLAEVDDDGRQFPRTRITAAGRDALIESIGIERYNRITPRGLI